VRIHCFGDEEYEQILPSQDSSSATKEINQYQHKNSQNLQQLALKKRISFPPVSYPHHNRLNQN
jgi:hypothetical protein